MWCIGTVDNHGNTEITESVIFVKCREYRDFAKMPCFCRVFCQNAIVLRYHKNILFLISIIWSLLCEFNRKLFTFNLPLLQKSVCFVTGGICDRDVIVVCILPILYFLPRDASAERGDATVSRPSVCPSVTFRYRVQIGWNSRKIISRPTSLRLCSGWGPTWAIWCNGNTPKIRVE